MECRKIRENLSAYIDKELNFLTRWKIKRHINTCPACKKEWLKLKKIDTISKMILLESPEPGFYQRLEKKLPGRKKVNSRKYGLSNLTRAWTFTPLAGKAFFVAGVAALIIFLSFIYPRFLSPSLNIDRFEEEYLRSRGEVISWVREPSPIILIQEQRG